MNLLVKKFRPLVMVLLAAVFAISCEDPGRIGLIVNADNGVITTHYADIVLPTSVVQFNPRKTSESLIIQAGQYFDQDFGLMTVKSYNQLSPSIFVQPNANAAYEGFEMTMGFTSFHGPEPLNEEIQKIAIYQLAEGIDTTKNYLRIDELALGSKLADWEFIPLADDTLRTDSTWTLALSDAIGEDLFDRLKAGDPMFESIADFNEYFKGVAFVNTPISNYIFRLDKPKIRFTIKYNEFNTSGTPIPRTYALNLGNNGFYHIESDKSGTALSGLMADNTDYYPPNDYRYIQYGTTIAIRADLTPFYLLSDTLQNMIINKAEISIGKVLPGNENNPVPNLLHIYFTDETNIWPVVDARDSITAGNFFVTLQDESQGVPPGRYGFTQSTLYDAENERYSVNSSLFFQNLYTGKFTSVSEPFLEEKGQIFIFGESDALYPQRTPTQILTTNMAVHKDSIRLRIHYTIPNLK